MIPVIIHDVPSQQPLAGRQEGAGAVNSGDSLARWQAGCNLKSAWRFQGTPDPKYGITYGIKELN